MIYHKHTITVNGTKYTPATPGEYIIQIGGTWGGATVVVHWDYSGGSAAYSGGSFSADGTGNFFIASGKFAFVVTNATGATNLKIFVAPVIGRDRKMA